MGYYGDSAARPSHANLQVSLPEGSTIADLLSVLSMPTEARGITFINGQLSAMPGLQPDLQHPLQNGDRVAFFASICAACGLSSTAMVCR